MRLSEAADIYSIAERMREVDKLECELSSGDSPEQALRNGYRYSDACFTVDVEGQPEIMFGLREWHRHYAWVWMLATDALLGVSRDFLRLSKPIINSIGQDYQVLQNKVYEHNSVHIRWLRWCGAEFDAPVEVPSGARFLPFRIYPCVTR